MRFTTLVTLALAAIVAATPVAEPLAKRTTCEQQCVGIGAASCIKQCASASSPSCEAQCSQAAYYRCVDTFC